MSNIQITSTDEALSYLTSCLVNQSLDYRRKLGEGSPIYVKHAKLAEQGVKLMRGLGVTSRKEDVALSDFLGSDTDIFTWMERRIKNH